MHYGAHGQWDTDGPRASHLSSCFSERATGPVQERSERFAHLSAMGPQYRYFSVFQLCVLAKKCSFWRNLAQVARVKKLFKFQQLVRWLVKLVYKTVCFSKVRPIAGRHPCLVAVGRFPSMSSQQAPPSPSPSFPSLPSSFPPTSPHLFFSLFSSFTHISIHHHNCHLRHSCHRSFCGSHRRHFCALFTRRRI